MIRTLGLDDLDVDGKRVLVRSDLNVPLRHGEVVDDFRILAAVPTIAELRQRGAKVIVCSHLGRPEGRQAGLRMDPVAARLAEVGSIPVKKIDSVVGSEAEAAIRDAPEDAVVMLENTRFEPGETGNAPELAEGLARLAELFVLDAFGSAHRAHASTVGVAERLPSAASPLVRAEVAALSRLLEARERPYVVILGGAKVSDKLGVMRSLLPKVDAMLVGGGMCFTLLKAEGYEVGGSLVEDSMIDEVGSVLALDEGGKVMTPLDIVMADHLAADAKAEPAPTSSLPEKGVGLDIGPDTVERFRSIIDNAEAIFWNGPMGVFEWERFQGGTAAIARAVAENRGFTVAGGGDTVVALRALGLEDRLRHLSTGGGAGLEMLEGKRLPGLAALERWADAS